ncbi:hypothetical protein [Lentzea sp. NPDC004782]|uniref:hypothetical protein n=1 Tax=Lentzea sp. NPDC004782 TaxID=3154458 RepID=UPI0033AE6339
MSNFRTIATAAALTGAAALAVVATSVAQASGTTEATPWCTGSDLAIGVYDMHSPTVKSKAHQIRLVSAEDASCRIGGSLSNVRFLDSQGRDVHASQNGGQPPYTETLVNEDRSAVVYVASDGEGPQLSPAFVRFNLPGQGKLGDLVTIPWPTSGIGANVRMGGVTAPVS